jgi:hypothetical protein
VKPDRELEAWRAEWQADAEVPADLRRKAARDTRFMRWMLAAEVLVTVTMGGGYTFAAVREPRLEMWILAGAVWIFLAAAWTFSLIARRGNWAPAAVTTAEFADLSIRRCRGKLMAMRCGVWLYFVQMAFCLVWLYRDPARRVPAPAIVFAVATPAFSIGVRWYRRRLREELAELSKLHDGDTGGR